MSCSHLPGVTCAECRPCDHKFVDSTVCLKCGVTFAELKAADAAERASYELRSAIEDASYLTKDDAPSYPDDVVAVMRDTITAQRELIFQERRLHDEIVARLEVENENLRARLLGSPLPEGM